MKCKRIEKWLSDKRDGELPEKKRHILEAHLAKCLSCQSYRDRLPIIEKEAKDLVSPNVGASYWQNSISRLRTKLASISREDYQLIRVKPSLFPETRWAWAGALMLLFIALGLFLILRSGRTIQEIYTFAFEDVMESIDQEIRNNPDLEEQFNSVILASIKENLGETNPFFYENPFFWEGLSEEELKLIETEIKREVKS